MVIMPCLHGRPHVLHVEGSSFCLSKKSWNILLLESWVTQLEWPKPISWSLSIRLGLPLHESLQQEAACYKQCRNQKAAMQVSNAGSPGRIMGRLGWWAVWAGHSLGWGQVHLGSSGAQWSPITLHSLNLSQETRQAKDLAWVQIDPLKAKQHTGDKITKLVLTSPGPSGVQHTHNSM